GHEFLGRLERGVGRGDAADQLDQFHQRNRIHEVNADELLRPVGRGGKPRDRNRRGVARDQSFWLQRRAKLGEYLALDVFLLGRRLDHQIAIGETVVVLSGADALESGGLLVLGNALAGDLARHVAVDRGECLFQARRRNVVDHNRNPGQRADMSDTVAHLARADDADLANALRHDWVRSLQRSYESYRLILASSAWSSGNA